MILDYIAQAIRGKKASSLLHVFIVLVYKIIMNITTKSIGKSIQILFIK